MRQRRSSSRRSRTRAAYAPSSPSSACSISSSDGLLERAGDALYMTLEEIEQALEGELGAYAARVRLRREDDRRWRNFEAPRMIRARAGSAL